MTAALARTSGQAGGQTSRNIPERAAQSPGATPQRNTIVDLISPRKATVVDADPAGAVGGGREVLVEGVSRPIRVKIASEPAEWEEALALVTQTYRSRGYEAPDATGLRFTPFHALPDTTTVVAKHDNRVAATLSLVFDNVLLGLPMESIYKDEIDALRHNGRHIVEVTSLADSGLGLREFVPVFVTMMRLMSQYSLAQAGTSLAVVISVNPRHSNFYRRVLGFVPLGERRAYPKVQNHPAEAYVLDLHLLRTNSPDMYQQIFGEPLPPAVLGPSSMPFYLVRQLGMHSSQTTLQEVDNILNCVKVHGSLRRWA